LFVTVRQEGEMAERRRRRRKRHTELWVAGIGALAVSLVCMGWIIALSYRNIAVSAPSTGSTLFSHE
jgi:hypothetical protein